MRKLIYYVEDDHDDAEIFVEAAKVAGTYVSTYDSCDKLLAEMKATEKLPALIFMDGRIPGCDRENAIKEIRAAANTASLPIVIYSGFIPPSEKEHLNSYEHILFESKKNSFAEIVDVIRKYLVNHNE